MRTVAILAFRGTTGAKTRLASLFAESERGDLAWRMLDHVLGVLRQSEAVDHLLIVTREPDDVRDRLGDVPGQSILAQPVGHAGLNGAFDFGRTWAIAHGYDFLLILHPDLPLLTPGDLHRFTQPHSPITLAVDSHGHGTNGLLLRLDQPGTHHFSFAFGVGSYDRHIAEANRLGLGHTTVTTNGLAHDLDEPDDWSSLPDIVRSRLVPEHSSAHSSL